MRYLKTILLLLIIAGCSEEQQESVDEADLIQADTMDFYEPDQHIVQEEPIEEQEDNSIEIRFDGMTVITEYIDMYWEGKSHKDKRFCTVGTLAEFDLHPGDWMFDKAFRVKEDHFTDVKLYHSIAVELSIDSDRIIEVPFCVLSKLGVHLSEWREVQLPDDTLRFMADEEYETRPFEYDLNAFKEALPESCGDGWAEEFAHVQDLSELEIEEFTSEYFFKIVATNTITGETIERIIGFFTPTHC